MDTLDTLLIENLNGKVVRKDLTALMKKGANVPTYVLEYLLGMYCTTTDEKKIQAGVDKISYILTNNYVHPDQSEYIKSKIREHGEYTIIDKLHVRLAEAEDRYIASFTNLHISPFVIEADIVTHNEKLLMGGIWCIIKIVYKKEKEDSTKELFEEDLFENKKAKKKVKVKASKYKSPFGILSVKPIQMPNLNLNEIFNARDKFSKNEWIAMLVRSAGYEPTQLSFKQQLHYLLRLVPLIQKNYNLVELGPRGTGKSHIYSEISPYSILISSGYTTVSNMFYNMASKKVGLVGSWDCIAFDEVAGISNTNEDMIQIMKNYMANGSFARGTNTVNSSASIVFEGNTFRTVQEMLRTSSLFEPFPGSYNNDSAFFDRIHAYLPGWEIPKLRNSLFTNNYGLISDCLSEFCHLMRKYDYTNSFNEYFSLNSSFNTRDDIAVRKTFSGLAKLIYPNMEMSKDEARELLDFAIECRRRVKEQLKKMNPNEFSDVNLGYIDNETKEAFVVEVPEQPQASLVFEGLEMPGYVYGVGRSINNKIGIYRLENKLLEGKGKLESKNIEGLGTYNRAVKESIIAAYNYFASNVTKIINTNYESYDYSLYFNDLQAKGVSSEISVAETVGLFSALTNRSVLPGLVICGKVVMSGYMMPITLGLEDIIISVKNAGAKKLLLPSDCEASMNRISENIKSNIVIIYYNTPLDAVRKALGIE